jgi:branched-chain amino acid aminotransferase
MTTIWFDGSLRPVEEARPSILAHTLHYGVGVFEGIRSYRADDGSAAIFRLADHVRRLGDSARVCHLTLPFEAAAIANACVEVLIANDLGDGYLRPLVYQDDATLGGLGASPPCHLAVIAQPWGAYLGEDGLSNGIHAHISAYRRSGHGGFHSRAKINGQYVASTLAKREALAQGFDEALLTDDSGHVCEGSGENLFIVRDRVLQTPPADAAILPGITRDTVLHLASEHAAEFGIDAITERRIPRDELILADEAFLTGTAAELTPLRMIDGCSIGSGQPGPITMDLQKKFFDLVKGRGNAPDGWRTRFDLAVRS